MGILLYTLGKDSEGQCQSPFQCYIP